MIQIWALYPDFEGAKKIHVLLALIWGFGGCWRFLTGVWHLDLDFDMVTGLLYTHDTNFGSLSWFWRCKEHPCPLSPHLGLWKTLEVPYWGLAYWSCLDRVTGLWSTHVPNFGSPSWFLRCKEHPCPLSPQYGLWRTLEVLTEVCHLDIDLNIFNNLI